MGPSGGGQGRAGAEESGQGTPGSPPPRGEEAGWWKPKLRGLDPGGFDHRPPVVHPLHPLHISQLRYHDHYVGELIQSVDNCCLEVLH